MNSNPSFYPKHLAKRYVQHWNQEEEGQQVAPAPLVTNINGQNVIQCTPVSNDSSLSSTMDQNRKISLPDTFITAMRQLFTLLDIDNIGQVHIEEIAQHWSTDGAGAILPPNIVPSLRKVTTPGGYLTFERFCAGLKIAILRHSAQRHRQTDTDSSLSSMEQSSMSGSGSDQSGSGEALASSPLSRTNSMPNLQQMPKTNISPLTAPKTVEICKGPPKPPRDPSRLSMLDIHKNSLGSSTSSLPSKVEPDFIWKAPPPPFVSKNRRNTIQNGFDIEKAKNLEEIKQILSNGMSLLDQTKRWYSDQLANLSDEFNTHQVQDVNNCLANFLQMPNTADYSMELQRRIDRLQDQNRMLTAEITRQSNRVTALEQDKRSLIKQLFQSSSTNSNTSTLR